MYMYFQNSVFVFFGRIPTSGIIGSNGSSFFFLMWTIFKVFIEFVTTLFLLYVLAAFFFFFWLSHIWDLNSPTREGAHTPFVGM